MMNTRSSAYLKVSIDLWVLSHEVFVDKNHGVRIQLTMYETVHVVVVKPVGVLSEDILH